MKQEDIDRYVEAIDVALGCISGNLGYYNLKLAEMEDKEMAYLDRMEREGKITQKEKEEKIKEWVRKREELEGKLNELRKYINPLEELRDKLQRGEL